MNRTSNHDEVKGLQELIALLIPDHKLGPPTRFRSWHLLSAFLAYNDAETPIGRYQLARELGLGGGSIRSLVTYLRKQRLIQAVKRRGHILSLTGIKYSNALKQVLVKHLPVSPTSYTIAQHNYGCHLRNRASRVTDGVRQRDAAIQAGASGATTLIQNTDPKFITMPVAHRIQRRNAAGLLQPFDLQTGDVIVIGSATTKTTARLGAIAAALTLLQ